MLSIGNFLLIGILVSLVTVVTSLSHASLKVKSQEKDYKAYDDKYAKKFTQNLDHFDRQNLATFQQRL